MDELGALILGERPKQKEKTTSAPSIIAPTKSKNFGKNPQLQPDEEKPDELGQLILGSTQAPTQPQPQPQAPAPKQGSTLSQVGQGLAALGDVTVGGVLPMAGYVAQAVTRPFTTPQKAEEIGQTISSAVAQPFGKAFGVTETAGYKGEALSSLMGFVGENASKGAEWISQKTGLPIQDVNHMMTSLGLYGGARLAPKVGGALETAGKKVFSLEEAIAEKAKAKMPSVRVEPVGGMQSAGSAATTKKATLDAALAEIKNPELKAQLAKENPANIDPKVLERYVDADSVGVQLLKGQAEQNPNLISFERNTRGQDPRFVQALNRQNTALQEKVAEVKEKSAPDVFAPDYVANAEGAMEFIGSKIKQNESAVGEAYKALDDFGAGKIEVDSKTFGQNAIKALSEKEDIDFLPSIIKTKIDTYAEGKPMNFAQYENLRTQIARETRKAQKADDGNAVHALTLVRGELEKLPLIGETIEAKLLADKARSTAKSEFDLLNRDSPNYNKVYADLVNGKTDTKDFIQSAVLRSKNKDFAKTMELFDDPTAKQHLRAGALDVIIRDSTDTSGKFKPAAFAKAIENLDVNKKLDVLFGEEAQMLRKIAKTGQLVEARPAGAFVNESNTATALIGQYGKRLAEQIPVVGRFVEPARQLLAEQAQKKMVEESLRPGAGVRIKDIGKEK
jgi:hypothetical protein